MDGGAGVRLGRRRGGDRLVALARVAPARPAACGACASSARARLRCGSRWERSSARRGRPSADVARARDGGRGDGCGPPPTRWRPTRTWARGSSDMAETGMFPAGRRRAARGRLGRVRRALRGGRSSPRPADAEGRGIALAVTRGGEAVDLAGASLYLLWRHRELRVRGCEPPSRRSTPRPGRPGSACSGRAAMARAEGTVDAQVMVSWDERGAVVPKLARCWWGRRSSAARAGARTGTRSSSTRSRSSKTRTASSPTPWPRAQEAVTTGPGRGGHGGAGGRGGAGRVRRGRRRQRGRRCRDAGEDELPRGCRARRLRRAPTACRAPTERTARPARTVRTAPTA